MDNLYSRICNWRLGRSTPCQELILMAHKTTEGMWDTGCRRSSLSERTIKVRAVGLSVLSQIATQGSFVKDKESQHKSQHEVWLSNLKRRNVQLGHQQSWLEHNRWLTA